MTSVKVVTRNALVGFATTLPWDLGCAMALPPRYSTVLTGGFHGLLYQDSRSLKYI